MAFLFADQFNGIPVLRTIVWSGMKALAAPHCGIDPGKFGPKPFRPGTPQPKLFVFTGVPRAGTAFSGNNINFDFGTSIDVKRTVSKYHNHKRVLNSKGLRGLKDMPGSTTIKQMQGSITNKSTARKYNNKKECMRLSQSKVLPGVQQSKYCQGYHNLKDCQGVS